jgi:hypothetical protein
MSQVYKLVVLSFLLTSVSSYAKERIPSVSAVAFKENKGQLKDQHEQPRNDIRFYGSTQGLSYYLKNTGLSYQLYKQHSAGQTQSVEPFDKTQERKADSVTIQRIDISWPGANPNAKIITTDPIAGVEHYYTSATPITDVKSYSTITYKDIYPSIDLKYYSNAGNLKYDYIVKPGADYKNIKIKIEGASSITKNRDGSIIIHTPLGDIQEGAPVAYQEGKRIEAEWKVLKDVLSFDFKNYDNTKMLVIDPLVREWFTYYGGASTGSSPVSGYDHAWGVANDRFGSVFMCGETRSITNIATTGTFQTTLGSLPTAGFGAAAFLVKFNSAGIRQWATYYGLGTTQTPCYVYANDCAVDSFGSSYICGKAQNCINCVTPGSFQGGSSGAFIAKLDSNGHRIWATVYGSPYTEARACVVGWGNNVYVAGDTPADVNIASSLAHQPVFGGGSKDGFLAKFDSAGVRQWGTYFGGSEKDSISGSSLATNGDLIVCGSTNSTNNIASSGSAVFQSSYQGTGDLNSFMARFDSNGTRMWATYFGADSTTSSACAVDSAGNIFLVGTTVASSQIATTGAHQQAGNGLCDGYVAKFDGSGARLWSTYYGGLSADYGTDCAVGQLGRIYICGLSRSHNNIATPGSFISKYPSSLAYDAYYLAEFSSNGVREWGTYSGPLTYGIRAKCATYNSDVYMCGETFVSGLGTMNAHQPGYGGGGKDAFLIKFRDCTPPLTPAVNFTPPLTICEGDSINLSATFNFPLAYLWFSDGDTISTPQYDTLIVTQSGTYFLVAFALDKCPTPSAPVPIDVHPLPKTDVFKTDVPCSGNPGATVSLLVTGGVPPYQYTWYGTSNTTSVASNLPVGTYVVMTSDPIGCSRTDTIQIMQSSAPMPSQPLADICAVTADSATGKNLVIWEKTGVIHASAYNIYRESSVDGQYNLVGSNLSGQFSTYLDSSSLPLQQSYRYKITEKDSCGNEFAMSSYHKTIHLTTNMGINSEINLVWNQYEGKPYNTHYIMRSINGGAFTNIAQVASSVTSYTDLSAPFGNKTYRIDIDLPSQCSPTAKTTAISKVSSNTVTLFVPDDKVKIIPNPTKGVVSVIGEVPAKLKVVNVLGQVVLEVSNQATVSLYHLFNGAYMINLYDESGRLYHTEKIIKN